MISKMIDLENLYLLDELNLYLLSNEKENNKTMIHGRYHVYCYNKKTCKPTEYLIEFDESSCVLSSVGSSEEKYGTWNVKDDLLNISPLGHIYVIFADRNIIYGSYEYHKIIIISDEYEPIIDDNDHVLMYFAKIENEWAKRRLKLFPVQDVQRYKNDASFCWGIPALAALLTNMVAYVENCYGEFSTLTGYLIFFALFVFYFFILRFAIILRRKICIALYKKNHPDDKLANATWFDPFDFKSYD